ncbi:MAG: flagellar basal-body MS-ring/collar protein FliF, partial [Smithellaceae bacterium]|nr:flagellar basal-body MS-ring/collar protein FliF [Smithellaceae bacterium]
HGGGVGFEIFDQKAIGTTDFEQQMNYRRALQGELMRTINSLDEIKSSRVHIALPKDSLFVRQQKKPTVSVTLRLKPGKTLKPPQIDGIAQLVASSIEGMAADDVMIVDNRGNILSTKYGDSRLAKLTSSQIDYQKNIERGLADSVQTLLEAVVGHGKAVVRVAADINFKVTEKTEEIFDAENPVIRSSQRQTERNVTPVMGAKSPTAGGDALSEKEKSSEILNYEINKVTNRTVLPTGDIQKLSIAAIIDGTYQKNDKGVEEYQPRTRQEIEALEQLVMKSAGFSQTRGDQVVVTNIALQKQPAELDLPAVPETWQEQLLAFTPMIKYAMALIAAIFIGLFLVRPLIRAVAARPVKGDQIAPLALTGPPHFAGIDSPIREAVRAHEEEISEIETVKKLAESDAKKFAILLKSWIK